MPLSVGTQNPFYKATTQWLDTSTDKNYWFGYPYIVQFWAISCPICKINMPRLQQLVSTYREQDLQLVSVHMPRSQADTDVEKVKAAVEELGLTGPCAIDNNHALGDLFQTGGVWPCYFLFDAEGKLRSRAAGALGIKMAENSLKRMLGTPDKEAIGAGELR